MTPDEIVNARQRAREMLAEDRIYVSYRGHLAARDVLDLSDQLIRERENAAALLHRPEPVSHTDLLDLACEYVRQGESCTSFADCLWSSYTITRKEGA